MKNRYVVTSVPKNGMKPWRTRYLLIALVRFVFMVRKNRRQLSIEVRLTDTETGRMMRWN